MLPAIYNPTIKQGVPFRRKLIITDAAGAAINLTGATVESDLRDADGALLAAMSCTVTTPLAGEIELLIADTSALPATSGQHILPYDVFVTPATGDRFCPLQGQVCVESKTTELA